MHPAKTDQPAPEDDLDTWLPTKFYAKTLIRLRGYASCSESPLVAHVIFITKTYLYNFDLLKPHFYIVKLGFTGVYLIFLISAQKHRLWVLVRTASLRRF